MEILILLAIGFVFGIPTIAIVAMVRSKTAMSRAKDASYSLSNLESEIAGLRRELVNLAASEEPGSGFGRGSCCCARVSERRVSRSRDFSYVGATDGAGRDTDSVSRCRHMAPLA